LLDRGPTKTAFCSSSSGALRMPTICAGVSTMRSRRPPSALRSFRL
jgi:ribosomal protein S12